MMGTCTVLSVLLPWGTGCKVWPQGLGLLPWIWGCSKRRVLGLAWEWHRNPHLAFHSCPSPLRLVKSSFPSKAVPLCCGMCQWHKG